MGRPSAKSRKAYNFDALLDVAVRVFLERGYDGSSLDQVARAAGITQASIYYHARGKEGLPARGAGRVFDALFAALAEPAAATGPAVVRLKHVVQRTIEITITMTPEVALLLRVRGNTRAERRILEKRREFDRLMAGLIEAAQKEKHSQRYRPAPGDAAAVRNAEFDHRVVPARGASACCAGNRGCGLQARLRRPRAMNGACARTAHCAGRLIRLADPARPALGVEFLRCW